MHIKAICTDIDGTLLDAKRGLSTRLLAAISKLPKDFPIILASSRMPAAMRHLQNDMEKSGTPMICYNGGYLIQDFESENKILDDVSIPLDFCEKISHLAINSQIHISLYHGEDWYESKLDHWAVREIRNTKAEPILKSAEDVFLMWKKENKRAHKVMCMGPVEEIDFLYKEDGVAMMIEKYLL